MCIGKSVCSANNTTRENFLLIEIFLFPQNIRWNRLASRIRCIDYFKFRRKMGLKERNPSSRKEHVFFTSQISSIFLVSIFFFQKGGRFLSSLLTRVTPYTRENFLRCHSLVFFSALLSNYSNATWKYWKKKRERKKKTKWNSLISAHISNNVFYLFIVIYDMKEKFSNKSCITVFGRLLKIMNDGNGLRKLAKSWEKRKPLRKKS